jgi:hypothetical protein
MQTTNHIGTVIIEDFYSQRGLPIKVYPLRGRRPDSVVKGEVFDIWYV